MNILIVNNQEFNPEIGGVERVSDILAREWNKRGYKVFFCALKKSEYGEEYQPAVEQTITDQQCEISKFINENNIDIILNQAGNNEICSTICYKVSKNTGVRLISEIHTDPMYLYKTYRIVDNSFWKRTIKTIVLPIRDIKTTIKLKKQYQRLCYNSEKIVLLSESYVDSFVKLVGKKYRNRVVVIENPCQYEPEQCKDKESVVICVGRLDIGKNIGRMLKIWQSVDNAEWKLMVIGDGPERTELEEYARKHALNNVIFTGYADPVPYYRKAKIICMTSRFEGLPMVLIEAQMFGCVPVVFGSFSAANDVIENDESGFIVKDNNDRHFAEKLEDLMHDEKLQNRMSRQVVDHMKKFDRENIMGKWDNILVHDH